MAKSELANIQGGLLLKNGVLNARRKKAKKISSMISEESQRCDDVKSCYSEELNNRSFYLLYFWDTKLC